MNDYDNPSEDLYAIAAIIGGFCAWSSICIAVGLWLAGGGL